MKEKIYTNYRLQLSDREVLGTLVVRDGEIADIQPDTVSIGQDGEGDYLLPGLVELHTDNLERCMSPRPGIRWPLDAAASYHDRDVVTAGITTVCDAIAIGDVKPTSTRLTHFNPMINAVSEGQKCGRFAADHRLHLRCEVSYPEVYDIVADYGEHPLLSLISVMDHTPGQRQFVKIEKYTEYYMGKYGISRAEMEEFIRVRQEKQQKYAEKNRQAIVSMTQAQAIALASHDDATVEHVREAVRDNAAIAEFPTTLEAAKESRRHGLQVLMGAPNLVLGGSHSGNISAMELVELDLVDVLSSDYVPRSLLQGIFTIVGKLGKPLHEAMKLVTENPATAIGLDGDRGSLEVRKRADFITVHHDGIVPRLTAVFVRGKRVG
ncbi:MAG: phosphonate metabolism protein PhnM [Cyanobacteria bacterium SBLK]|nr:phosphonate metabolism protein PhnM [Cyanobacteria bacterium SBLK]